MACFRYKSRPDPTDKPTKISVISSAIRKILMNRFYPCIGRPPSKAITDKDLFGVNIASKLFYFSKKILSYAIFFFKIFTKLYCNGKRHCFYNI